MNSGRAEALFGQQAGPVQISVLGLIIEQPSYPFELWNRYNSRYGDLHKVSKQRIYGAVGQLENKRYIEGMEAEPAETRWRAPISYRATALGARTYRGWLAASFPASPARDEFVRRLLTVGARNPKAMLRIIDLYEETYLREAASRQQFATPGDREVNPLLDKLLREERRLSHEAQLRFVAFARRVLTDALDSGADT